MSEDKGSIGETLHLVIKDGQTGHTKKHLVVKNGVSKEIHPKDIRNSHDIEDNVTITKIRG